MILSILDEAIMRTVRIEWSAKAKRSSNLISRWCSWPTKSSSSARQSVMHWMASQALDCQVGNSGSGYDLRLFRLHRSEEIMRLRWVFLSGEEKWNRKKELYEFRFSIGQWKFPTAALVIGLKWVTCLPTRSSSLICIIGDGGEPHNKKACDDKFRAVMARCSIKAGVRWCLRNVTVRKGGLYLLNGIDCPPRKTKILLNISEI